MQPLKWIPTKWMLLFFLISSLVISAVSCTSNAAESEATPTHSEEQTTDDSEDEADPEHEDDHEDEEAPERIPNNGAIIRLQAPADGDSFQADQEIIVEIEVENFAIDQDGNHWELYVDGSSWGSIDGRLQEVLRGLEPGEHEIMVLLANGDHQELEEGDSATITVSE